jgi:GDP-L-fucose synthase
MTSSHKYYVAGHRGLVGSAICRALEERGDHDIVKYTSYDIDLRDATQAEYLFSVHRPQYVFLTAAEVGGIMDNKSRPADFILHNLQIQNNVMQFAHKYGAKKLLFLGSACAYPKFAANPIRETSLMTGVMEPTNAAYATAKIAGIQMCKAFRQQHGCDFISCMPTNLYGIGDTYDLEASHVIPGMILRQHGALCAGARKVVLWGTGAPVREFLYADDLARACLLLMDTYSEDETINIGSGNPVPLWKLAMAVQRAVCFRGMIEWDSTHPDGTPVRILDNSKIFSLGWAPKVSLDAGLALAYQDLLCRPH